MYLRIRPKIGRPLGKKIPKAQVTLEVALSLVGVFILLLATVKIFLWLNERIILRQQDYEAKRVEAGSWGKQGNPAPATMDSAYIDESHYPKLDIFNGD